jgi:dTDP-4-dehydrorhamnose reductase
VKVLLTGAAGQLGTEMCTLLQRNGVIVTPLTRDLLDLRDPESIRAWIRAIRPDWVVNTAAYHRTDECEDHPEEAFLVNATAVFRLAAESAEAGARFVHFSTDYVFDGRKGAPYTEEDPPNPLNVYGTSKYAGEVLAHIALPESLIIRTSGMFGVTGTRQKGGNFIDRIAERARRGESLKIVADVRFSPTYAEDLAEYVFRLMREGAKGIFHIVNQGEATWAEFGRAALAALGIRARVEEISLKEAGARAKRPCYSVLAMNRLREVVKQLPRSWPEALQHYSRRMRERSR